MTAKLIFQTDFFPSPPPRPRANAPCDIAPPPRRDSGALICLYCNWPVVILAPGLLAPRRELQLWTGPFAGGIFGGF